VLSVSTTRVTRLQAQHVRVLHAYHAGRADRWNRDIQGLPWRFSISYCIWHANCQCPTVSWNWAADNSKSPQRL